MDMVAPLPPMRLINQDVPTRNVRCARIGTAEEAMMDRVRECNFQQQNKGLSVPWDDPMNVHGNADMESEYNECLEIPKEFIETVCTDIRGAVITGEVCSTFLLPRTQH